MSGKKQKLLKKYLKKRKAIGKKDFNGSQMFSVEREIKNSYKTANRHDKRVLSAFFKGVIKAKNKR